MFCHPMKKKGSYYHGPPTCTMQVENIETICGRIVSVGTLKLNVSLSEQ
jgi:hypothetical protein